jgi:hypothetical protein
MFEIVALVITGYVLFTIGIGTLIGKGHHGPLALATVVPSAPQHRAVREHPAEVSLAADWDTRWDVARSDGVAWELVA